MKKRRRRNPLSAAAKARWKKAGSLAWRGTKGAARIAGKTAYHTGRIAGKSIAAGGRVAGNEVKGMICRPREANPRVTSYNVHVSGVHGGRGGTQGTFATRAKAVAYAKMLAKEKPWAKVSVWVFCGRK